MEGSQDVNPIPSVFPTPHVFVALSAGVVPLDLHGESSGSARRLSHRGWVTFVFVFALVLLLSLLELWVVVVVECVVVAAVGVYVKCLDTLKVDLHRVGFLLAVFGLKNSKTGFFSIFVKIS